MPRAEFGDGTAEPVREPRVELALPAPERLGCRTIAGGERLEQLLLVELVVREREREPVAMAERPGRLVAEAGEPANVVGDGGADGLRRLPRLAALGGVVALTEDPLDLVVVDLLAADDAAVSREPRLDRGLELDDPCAQRLGHLVREHEVAEQLEPAADEPVAVRGGNLKTVEELAVREQVRPLELRRRAAVLRLVRRLDVRVPPGDVPRAGTGSRRASASSTSDRASLTRHPVVGA